MISSTYFLNNGITEPLELTTFPYRTIENLHLFLPTMLLAAIKVYQANLVVPYISL